MSTRPQTPAALLAAAGPVLERDVAGKYRKLWNAWTVWGQHWKSMQDPKSHS